jgi:TonB family protein
MRIRLTSWLGVLALAVAFPSGASAQTTSPAESALLARVSSQPNDPAAYLDLAKLYSQQRRFDDALRIMQRAMAVIEQQRAGMGTRTLVGGSGGVTPVQIGGGPPQTGRPSDMPASGLAPVRVGGAVPVPRKIVDVKPVYPPIAQTAKVQGIVIIESVIATDGSVKQALVLRGQPLLDEAAIEAVRQWRFTPTLLNGVPVEVVMTVTVNFTLGGRTTLSSPQPTAISPDVGFVRVGRDVKEPRKLKEVLPIYPQAARDANVQGIVIMEIGIGVQGNVTDAKVVRGVALLDEAAIDAVKQWEFEPTLINGVATPVLMTVTIRFTRN